MWAITRQRHIHSPHPHARPADTPRLPETHELFFMMHRNTPAL